MQQERDDAFSDEAGGHEMRNATLTSAILVLLAATNAAAQGPMMLADAVIIASPKETPEAAARTISSAHFLRSSRAQIGQSTFGEWQVAPTLTAPLEPSGPGMHLPFDDARSEGAGRLGAMLGWVVGMSVGGSIFEGQDLGCNKYGECFGQIDSREAVVAGAVVMGGIGFIGGRLLGSVGSPEWCDKIPLDALQIGVAPRGKPGLKFSTGIRF